MLDYISIKDYSTFHVKINLREPLLLGSDKPLSSSMWINYHCDAFGIPLLTQPIITKAFVSLVNKEHQQSNDLEFKNKLNLLIDDIYTPFKKDRLIYFRTAYVSNYTGIRNSILFLSDYVPHKKSNICDFFTKRINISHSENSYYTRAILPKYSFETFIVVKKGYEDIVYNLIQGCHVFNSLNETTCKIELDIKHEINTSSNDWIDIVKPSFSMQDSNDNDQFRLYYSLENISELVCSDSKFQVNTILNYIPGIYIQEIVKNYFYRQHKSQLDNKIKFSNAYPSINGKRSIVCPKSFVVNKLDKSQLRDRTLEMPRRLENEDFEQLVSLGWTFIDNVDSKEVYSADPVLYKNPVSIYSIDAHDKKTITSYDINGISPVTEYCGFIQGSYNQLQKIGQFFSVSKFVRVGLLCNQGFGSCSLRYKYLESQKTNDENFQSRFVIRAASHILLYDENGNESIRTTDLLKEICYLCNIDDELVPIITNVGCDEVCPGSPELSHRPSAWRCIEAGSVYYVKTKNNTKIDISQISKIWVGAHQNWGYGEIDIYAPEHLYKKKISEIDPSNRKIIFNVSEDEFSKSQTLIQDYINSQLKIAIVKLAKYDSMLNFKLKNDDTSESFINLLKDCYGGTIRNQELIELFNSNKMKRDGDNEN